MLATRTVAKPVAGTVKVYLDGRCPMRRLCLSPGRTYNKTRGMRMRIWTNP